MYRIKQIPEDFLVNEISGVKFDKGQYSYFRLKKRNLNTLSAVEIIASKLKINRKNIGFAGNKDKNAVTEQTISVYGAKNFESIAFKDIELKFLGRGSREVFLGNLKGNEFTVTVRNLTNKEIKNLGNTENEMPNYFGPQRFSGNNHIIGKAIIKKELKKAIAFILDTNSNYNKKIQKHLESRKNDFVGALKIIPLKLLKLYIHSYQSYIFNKTLEQYIKNKNEFKDKNLKNINNKTAMNNNGVEKNKKLSVEEKYKHNNKKITIKKSENNDKEANIEGHYEKINNKKIITDEKILSNTKNNKNPQEIQDNKIPIVGFGTELGKDEISGIIKKTLQEEKINPRDFIIKAMPELSSEGGARRAFFTARDFEILEISKDELNKNKEKAKIRFFLPKGSYATVLVDYLFGRGLPEPIFRDRFLLLKIKICEKRMFRKSWLMRH